LGLKDKEIIVDTAHKILIRSLSVRDTEALVKKLNKIYESAQKEEDEDNVDDDLIVDYIKDLEKKAMSLTGKRIKIQTKGKCRMVQIEYLDNEDLEDIMIKLCGKKIAEE
jgi:ParB-like chromosome segregation protein Spo0J